MTEIDNKSEKQKRRFSPLRVLLGVLVALLPIFIFMAPPHHSLNIVHRIICGSNLKAVGEALRIYANDSGIMTYPTPNDWCDLLMSYWELHQEKLVEEKQFLCRGALEKDDRGPCHYAINPNCRPNSPYNTVLLFETKGGWNQFGGPEMLTTENHNGCNVLFNDGSVRFVKTEKLDKLKW